jgi:hypothetical protein
MAGFRGAVLLCFLWPVAIWPCVARGQLESTDGRYLRGLRQRQLFTLAEAYCQERLADSRLKLEDRADLVVHLSQTYCDHAREAPQDRADELWDNAVRVTEEFARTHSQGTWPLLVRAQGGLALVSRGEWLRQAAELTGEGPRLLEQAKEFLRRGIKELRDVSTDLLQAMRTPARGKDQLSRDELLSLEKNLKHQLAVAYRNQGLCYTEESPDRDNSLRQAVEQLSTLVKLSPVDPLAWQARLEEITCLRLMKQAVAVQRRLAELDSEEPPPQVRLRARAERVRLHLAAADVQAALGVLQTGRRIDGQIDAEFDFAHLETYLAAWKAAVKSNDKPASQKWQAEAANVVRGIEQQHPPYWARRAEGLLASVITDTGVSGNLAVLVRAAQGYYRGKQFADAVKAYDEAAAMALGQKQADQAFDLAYTAATIEHEQKNHAAAMRRYRKLALDQQRHAKAPEAHLLAVFNAAQEARLHKPPKLDDYVALLREHLQTWPNSATVHQAHWHLGQFYEYDRRLSDALAEYRAIDPSHEQFKSALTAIARCYDVLLAQARSSNKSTVELAAEAAGYFERLVLPGQPPQWPERWSPNERLAAVAACRFRLDYAPGDPRKRQEICARAEQFLTRALQGQPPPPAEWKHQAQSLLVVALAGQGTFDDAGKVVSDLASAPPPELLGLMKRLSTLSEAAAGDVRKSHGKLQAQAAGLLANRRPELSAPEQKAFDLLQARALAASGDAKRAIPLFEELAKANPRDGDIQEALAATLLEAGDRSSLEAALIKWREVERNSRAASPRWFRAKYHLALTHERLGDPRRAAEIIKVTQVLHPELGGTELKSRFLEMLKRCETDRR